MNLFQLLKREICYRKLNFALSLTSVALGVACVSGTVLMLRVFDQETEQALTTMAQNSRSAWDKFQEEMRKDMLSMGFNLMILHKDYNLSSPPDQARYLPESYIQRLAESRLATINHVLPFLQQKVWWPERKRWVTLVGTTGEVYVQSGQQKPMLPRVQKDHAILGFAIHQSLNVKTGDELALCGRTFTVQECRPAKGFDEDEQIWIPLADSQEILDKKGLITGMLAVNCQCAPKDLIKIHREVGALLPDTRVVEHNSQLVARANVRSKSALEADQALARETAMREQLKEKRLSFAAILLPLVAMVSIAWLAFLVWSNVQQRRAEIGILSAMGVPPGRILLLFIAKAVVVGFIGSLIGFCLGVAFAVMQAGLTTRMLQPADAGDAAIYMAAAVMMSVVGSWVPAMLASRIDPAVTLREE